MKRIKLLSTLLLCLFLNTLQAQNMKQCVHCNMNIQDDLHRVLAEIDNKTIYFDAIECLINYLKTNDEDEFSLLQVSDYETGQLIDVKKATYLKSKAIPSPMGANLSAFKREITAMQIKNDKGGETYKWETIKAEFKDSKYGALEHSNHDHYRPDAHAPMGIMGDHLHQKGGFMLSLRYMNMAMDGNKSGTDDISDDTIYSDYMAAPQDMTMQMYMLGVMYAPSNKLTLFLMQGLAKKDMDLTARMVLNGMTMLRDFSTSSSGLGDLKVGAMYGLFNNHKSSFHLNGKLNIPIGDVENRDDSPIMNNVKLPYAMQLGSGTFDISLGATYKENFTNTSWGTQFLSTLRTGKNSEDYRFGNLHQLNIWAAYKLTKNFSISGRIIGVSEGNLKGIDSDLNPMMVPTANTANYGSDKIKTFAGMNIAFPETSSLKDFRFGFEVGAPIYENYNGVQMNENLTLNFGVKYNVI